MSASLVGYQSREHWMGVELLTLADVWPEQPRAMIVGLNPAPTSVSAGHYYQGRTGQRQLSRLASAGVIGPPREGVSEETVIAAGIGFTDIVKRPTRSEREVKAAEIEYGRRRLCDALAERGVPVVICMFRHPVQALLGSADPPGVQLQQTNWGATVFRMPGPFDARHRVQAVMAQLSPLLV